jgi:hypothetical protein
MTFEFSDVLKFKKEVEKDFGVNVHFHDSCGGQYFTLENSDKELSQFITNYFKKQNLQVEFSNDGLQFTVK